MTSARQQAPKTPSTDQRRIIRAGIVGNVLEWYDYALYGYLATVFASEFFPSDDKLTSLIGAYAVFAIGFLARPLGGVIYGHIGDRFGRRWMLTISVVMMGVPTFLLGLLPTYASIGIWAPALLVVLRFVQGISAGGEFSGSVVFLVEHAPSERRGAYGSISNSGAMIGGLAGAGIAWAVVAALPADAASAWGWRLPFLSAIVVTAIGLWVRLGVSESPAFRQIAEAGELEDVPILTAVRENKKEIAITAGLNWTVSAGYYIVFVWFVSDLSKVVGMKLSTALAISTFGMFIGAIATPLSGWLADRVGPRRMLLIGGIATVVATTPLLLLAGIGTIWAASVAQLGLALIVSAYLGVLPAVYVSLHDTQIRASSLSLGYNFAVAVFGGTAPLIATTLVKATGWQIAPGIYFCASALIGLALLRYVPRRFDER